MDNGAVRRLRRGRCCERRPTLGFGVPLLHTGVQASRVGQHHGQPPRHRLDTRISMTMSSSSAPASSGPSGRPNNGRAPHADADRSRSSRSGGNRSGAPRTQSGAPTGDRRQTNGSGRDNTVRTGAFSVGAFSASLDGSAVPRTAPNLRSRPASSTDGTSAANSRGRRPNRASGTADSSTDSRRGEGGSGRRRSSNDRRTDNTASGRNAGSRDTGARTKPGGHHGSERVSPCGAAGSVGAGPAVCQLRRTGRSGSVAAGADETRCGIAVPDPGSNSSRDPCGPRCAGPGQDGLR